MELLEETNLVTLKGKINKEIEESHESFNEKFYKTELAVSRLSGECDYINIIISEKDLIGKELTKGMYVLVEGQVRSYNHYNKETEKRRLVLNVFTKKIEQIKEEDIEDKSKTNQVELIGYICKEPTYRKTPFGREISDILLAVNRNYKKSDYLPVIAWGRNARFASKLEVGENVKVIGRFQSRDYVKEYEDGTKVDERAFEISALEVELVEEKEETATFKM